MKRWIAFALIMCALLLAGCGGNRATPIPDYDTEPSKELWNTPAMQKVGFWDVESQRDDGMIYELQGNERFIGIGIDDNEIIYLALRIVETEVYNEHRGVDHRGNIETVYKAM